MIKHKKTVFAEDGTDPNAVHPSDWNDEHAIDGFLGLLDTLVAAPNAFPAIAADGSAVLAPISAPALAMLSKLTAALMLAAIGGASTDSPNFTGTPTAPTAALGVNTGQIATMAALKAMRDDLVNSAPGVLDTLKELADALGDDPNFSATMAAALANRLRVDVAQGLTTVQKAQAIANLALATVAASGSYNDLLNLPTLGTAASKNVGTLANQVVQLDASAKLPAIDGSQLTNIAGSLSYAAAQSLTDAQKLQALSNVSLPPDHGRFSYVSATACKFVPFRGDLIKINGLLYRIPAAGIAGLANTGVYINGVAGQNLGASTLYYVYAFSNAGVVTADFSTTGHATSATAGNVGTEIKTADDTRSLIGMVITNASSQFQDSATAIAGVASWFNRRSRQLASAVFNGSASGAASFYEVSTALRLSFLVWGDENWISASATGDAVMSTNVATNIGFGIGLDGVSPLPGSGQHYSANQNHNFMSAVCGATGLSEGLHYVTMLGGTNSSLIAYTTAGTTARVSG